MPFMLYANSCFFNLTFSKHFQSIKFPQNIFVYVILTEDGSNNPENSALHWNNKKIILIKYDYSKRQKKNFN